MLLFSENLRGWIDWVQGKGSPNDSTYHRYDVGSENSSQRHSDAWEASTGYRRQKGNTFSVDGNGGIFYIFFTKYISFDPILLTHSTKHFYIFWISLQIKRTSFGSGEDVLEEMFATWEPFLSKAMELLGIESLAKVCAIHAAVEKVNYCLVLKQYFQKVNIRNSFHNY